MYRIVVFVLLATIFASGYGASILPRGIPKLDGRIVGGEPANIEDYPYQVSVRFLGSHMCGGSIISDNHVLTAAHCIMGNYPLFYSIRHGSSDLNVGGNDLSVERLIVHENYDSRTIDFDIALIVLQSAFKFSDSIQAIPLASKSPAPGTLAVVTGWGTLAEGGSAATTLQKVEVPIVASDVCKAQYAGVNTITENMLCAGFKKGGQDACQGDSGGPMAVDGELVGVVSWGVGCARPDYSGVYTRVSALIGWVEENTKQF